MNRKDKAWVCVGVALFAVVIGILVGASASPTAGVMVTALFAVGATGLSIFSQPDAKREQFARREIDFRALGQIVSLFSILLFGGVITGAELRASWWPSWHQGSNPAFPWNAVSTPTSAERALDWLVIQEWLHERGYSQEQVRDLYRLQFAEWQKSGGQNSFYRRPLSEMLPSTPKRDLPDFVAENRPLDSFAGVADLRM